jgi:hypothetical protein
MAIVPATPSLEGIPVEIRQQIFSDLVPLEQESDQEYCGLESDVNRVGLPLHKARPPALSQVSRRLRHEYLPYFLENTTVRIYARPCKFQDEQWNPSKGGPWHGNFEEAFNEHQDDTRDQDKEESVDDDLVSESGLSDDFRSGSEYDYAPADQFKKPPQREHPFGPWLDYLDEQPSLDVRFRHVQFRPLNTLGEPLGLNVNIDYNPRLRKYSLKAVLDEGDRVEIIHRIIHNGGVIPLSAPDNIIASMVDHHQVKYKEMLSIFYLEHLELLFHVAPLVDSLFMPKDAEWTRRYRSLFAAATVL